ncbi:poly(A) polymerase [Microlunatus soli]|uniref:Poly(A) polymerase n=1 Tax=Microlunatus soli TaxID=630515 RepID=A0A1H1UMK9_9ACTN|nr:CCA tRNA nucleotidyltransferase [Microlunatus soli]SDS73541.1 poly(A) polymerase [Microlunatus soli]
MQQLFGTAPVVDELGTLFTDAGHSLYLVGGSVRDALLGELGHDLDFTTSARPDEIERLLRTRTSTIWTVGREFGTIGGRIGDWQIEITTFRADAYAADSRKPAVEFGDNLSGDLIRRDFTVNAMALSLPDHAFVDPYGGVDDLIEQRLRTPTAPEVSFTDDPLRMLRAARFAARLGLVPTPELVAAMTELADRLSIVSAERISDEFAKLLLTDHPRIGLDLLVRTGLADQFLPELPALRLERDEHHRHKDVYVHSLIVLEQAIDLERIRGHQPDLVNRLAALLHDIGKPRTRKFEAGGKVTFHHHDVVGAKMARKRLKALRFSSEQIDAVAQLIELHLRFHGYSDTAGDGEGGWTDSAVRRYVRDAGDQLERLHMLTRADCTTRNQAKATRLRRAYDELEWRIDELAKQEELDAMRPDLDGNQIMQILGIQPGRQVGEAYKHLLELRIDNGPLGHERAEAELRTWWAAQPHD